MREICVFAVVEKDLQLIARLQNLAENIGVKSTVARSAEEAVLYFRGVGIYRQRDRHPIPALVLLDSTNANASDLTMLSWLRDSTEYQNIPVGILCDEPEHDVQVICALDPKSYIVDRTSLQEVPEIVLRAAVDAKGVVELTRLAL